MGLVDSVAGVLTIGSTSISLYDRILKQTYKCSMCGRPDEHKGKKGFFGKIHLAEDQNMQIHLCKRYLKKYRPIIETLLKSATDEQFTSPYSINKDEFIEELFE